MWAEKTIPERASYRHVLVRFDWNPRIAVSEQNYGESRKSRCVPWPAHVALPKRPPGRVDRYRPTRENPETMAMFVMDGHLRTRMVKLGWIEVTKEWDAPAPEAGAKMESESASEPRPLRTPAVVPAVVALGAPVGPTLPPGASSPTGRHARAPRA